MISFRERNPMRIGVISIIVLGLMFLLVFEFKKLPFVEGSYTLTAEFADAAGINKDNEVRVAGIKVGRVSNVVLGTDRVIVELKIRNGVKIPNDATAEISLKTILGTKFVVVNATGSGAPLPDHGRIPLAHTAIPFEIYQIANSAVDLISDVDGKQLNDAFDALAAATKDPNRNLARTLEGAAKVLKTLGPKKDAIDTLIVKGDEVLASLAAASPDIQKILQHGNVVMEVLARRRATVQALLRNTDLLASQLGGLLRDKHRQLDTILDDLHATLKIVDASLGQLEQAVSIIGPSTEAFARITWRGRWASVCTMALESTILPPPLPVVSVGTGPAGSQTGPVDCANAATASTSASHMNPRAEP